MLVESGPTWADPWILPTSIGDLRLQGRADRIEVRGDALRVVDFKTGSLKSLQSLAGSDDPLDDGRKLQLPIYAAMEADTWLRLLALLALTRRKDVSIQIY